MSRLRGRQVGGLPGPDDLEDELLDGTAAERPSGSRLSWPLVVGEDWDGLIVHMPENQ